MHTFFFISLRFSFSFFMLSLVFIYLPLFIFIIAIHIFIFFNLIFITPSSSVIVPSAPSSGERYDVMFRAEHEASARPNGTFWVKVVGGGACQGLYQHAALQYLPANFTLNDTIPDVPLPPTQTMDVDPMVCIRVCVCVCFGVIYI